MYQLKRGEELIAESSEPIVWTESELAWNVITPEISIYYCDSTNEMTVTEVTDP